MALRKVKGNLERLFDKSLTDLVRGIRNNRDNEVSVTSISATEADPRFRTEVFTATCRSKSPSPSLIIAMFGLPFCHFYERRVGLSYSGTAKR